MAAAENYMELKSCEGQTALGGCRKREFVGDGLLSGEFQENRLDGSCRNFRMHRELVAVQSAFSILVHSFGR